MTPSNIISNTDPIVHKIIDRLNFIHCNGSTDWRIDHKINPWSKHTIRVVDGDDTNKGLSIYLDEFIEEILPSIIHDPVCAFKYLEDLIWFHPYRALVDDFLHNPEEYL